MFMLWYGVLGYSEYKSRSSESDGVVVQSGKGDQPKSGEQNVVSPKISIGKPTPTPTPPQPIPARKSPPKPEPPKPQPPAKVPPKPDPPKSVEPPKPAPPAKPEPPKPAPKSREDQLFEQVLNRKTKASTPDPRVTGLMLNEYSSEEEEEEDSQSEDFVEEERRLNTKMVDQATLDKLEAGFAKFSATDSKSLLKKYLTKEIFDALKVKKTSFGSTLLDVVQSGFENPDSGVGIYAPDAESYTVFADLFDPIIEDYHKGFKKTDKHPPKNWGDVDSFANLDPAGEYIISTRVRCGRSLQGYPFNPCLTEAQYKEMEEKVSSTLSGLEGELKGQFYPLTGMSKEVQTKLIDDHFLFKEGDRFLQAANACRFWPTGRGIYHNDNKTFLVWCNEEDHLRLISMQQGGDLGQVYRRLVSAVNDIEKRIPFSHDDRLGFLTFCPTNLGTTVRASVHIKVPKLAANLSKLEEIAGKYNLQVRGTAGEHTESVGGVYDISNKRRMGLTEYEAVKEMNDGITELIKLEKAA